MKKLIVLVSCAIALSACSKSHNDGDGSKFGGGGGNENLKACSPEYTRSLTSLRNSYAELQEMDRRGAPEQQKQNAGRAFLNECVQHFEGFGLENCTINGQRAIAGEPKDVYKQCKNGG